MADTLPTNVNVEPAEAGGCAAVVVEPRAVYGVKEPARFIAAAYK
jgi:hypothetical protein